MDHMNEEEARNRASEAHHENPRHPDSCQTYAQHAASMGRNDTRCPCENEWRMFVEQEN